MDPNRHLHRSRENRMIAGVCGGVAEYTGLDPTLVRLCALFIPGVNLVTYLICAILLPDN